MVLLKVVLLLVAYSADAFLLAAIMREKFEPVYHNRIGYFAVYGGLYFLSLLKQLVSFSHLSTALNTVFIISVQVYIIWLVLRFYEGKWYRKLIVYGIYNVLALLSEGLVFWAALLGLLTPIDKISEFGTVNILCTSLTKVVFSILIYLVFVKNSKAANKILHGKDILPILLSVTVLHIPAIALFDRPRLFQSSKMVTSYFLIVQIILLGIMLYIFYVIQKNKMEIRAVEQKLESAEEVIRLTTSLRELRHDMSFHVNILLDLAYKGDREDVIRYMENTFQCVKIVEDTFHLEDQAVSSSLNLIAQKTKEKHVEFKHIILVEHFLIPSHEMCSLLLNILSNAMDATEKVRQRKIICLEIAPTNGGYQINCMNTYKNKPVFRQGSIVSSKSDLENHGKGIRIIKKIVEKYGGAMSIKLHDDTKVFEINCFIPSRAGEILDER